MHTKIDIVDTTTTFRCLVNEKMCGIRTAGDLVAWMQLTRHMKINEAKQYVAGKLEIDVVDLCNEEGSSQWA